MRSDVPMSDKKDGRTIHMEVRQLRFRERNVRCWPNADLCNSELISAVRTQEQLDGIISPVCVDTSHESVWRAGHADEPWSACPE